MPKARKILGMALVQKKHFLRNRLDKCEPKFLEFSTPIQLKIWTKISLLNFSRNTVPRKTTPKIKNVHYGFNPLKIFYQSLINDVKPIPKPIKIMFNMGYSVWTQT